MGATKKGSHGGHWDCLIAPGLTQEEWRQQVVEWLKRAIRFGEADSYDVQGLSVYTDVSRGLGVRVLVEKGEVITTFPYIHDGALYEVEIQEIVQWANGVEAQIRGGVSDEARVCFFDTSYWRSRGRYETGRRYLFKLAALAYSVQRVTETRLVTEDGKRLDLSGAKAYLPVEGGDIDDFFFYTAPEEIKVIDLYSSPFQRWWVTLARLDAVNFSLPLYVLTSKLQGSVEPADDVQGVLWLQGSLA